MNEQDFLGQAKSLYGLGADSKIDIAFKAYKTAVESKELDFCIVGRKNDLIACLSIKKDGNESDFFDIYTYAEKSNFTAGNSTQGGQYLNADNWSLLLNDAWILGSIEAGKTFYLSKQKGFSSFKDVVAVIKSGDEKHPLTITARELIGLYGCGYTPVLMGDDSLAFSRTSRHDVPTLITYNTQRYNFMQKDNKDNIEVCKKTLESWLGSLF